MTTPTPSDVLKHYAHQLQLAAPEQWQAFVQCFDAYAMDVTVAVTRVGADEILNCQGKAQAFLHLLDVFRTCADPSSKTANQSQP